MAVQYATMRTLHGGLTEILTVVTEPESAKRISEPIEFSGEHDTARSTLGGWHLSDRQMRRENRYYRSRAGRMLMDRDAWHQCRNQPYHGLIGGNPLYGPRKAAVSSGYRKPKAAPRQPIVSGYVGSDSRHIVEGFREMWDEMDNPPEVISVAGEGFSPIPMDAYYSEWDDPGAMWDDNGHDHSDPYYWDEDDDDYWYGYVHPKWWDHETRAIDYYDQRHGWNIYDGSPV